ncbi:hypothetical protein [Schaalia vaccimaxillae]|uniref:hypothetical protein n=1 Tax=Schaalia vaccimaxillae TaxID=183916 RepID=UPI001FB0A2E2|nr:hypothetical protein [Schaalia vaccimaxillae]
MKLELLPRSLRPSSSQATGASQGSTPSLVVDAAAGTNPLRPTGARQRLYLALMRGATPNAAAAEAGISQALADIIIDEFSRQGLLDRAESLCSSGLGACSGGDGDDVRIHCAGCPLIPMKITRIAS